MSWESQEALSGVSAALVHDWLTGMRGGEKVLEAFCRLLPSAPIFTLLHLQGKVSPLIESHPIETSFLQRMPLAATRYRHYLPLFPRAVEGLRLPPVDLVLSTSHCVAKGVRPPDGAIHVSFVHTPMRYVWDMYDAYFGPGKGGLARHVMPFFRKGLQRWDVRTADRVDHFVANSAHVAERIKRHYDRESTVIHPPVDTARFSPVDKPQDYYLVVSALVPYKRVDLAVQACQALGYRLKVVGIGPEEARLKSLAGPKVEFLGWQPEDALPGLYANAKALIFPGEEDFGITPVESMAAGRPVLALGQGGALETVVGAADDEGRAATGRFFYDQELDALVEAMRELESGLDSYDPHALARYAAGFDTSVFLKRTTEYIQGILDKNNTR